MNIQESDILLALTKAPYTNQRILSETCGHSLGIVNRSLKHLEEAGYLDPAMCLTEKARAEFREQAPQNAIILAAGFGLRMVPINMETSKGLLEVNGEILIERIIRQLHEVDIHEIYVVVGFMKEHYEYLIDEYHVELIVNPEYAVKNNLHSLKKALPYLSNTYIVPCDLWCGTNPFRRYELYAWYLVTDLADDDSQVRVNRKFELVSVPKGAGGNTMVGIAYLTREKSAEICEAVSRLCQDTRYDNTFWEEALYKKGRMVVSARVVHFADVAEFNTYEELREFDSGFSRLRSKAVETICQSLQAQVGDVRDITVLKKGMTNRSFLFTCKGEKYIMRIPGEGTERLIDRKREAEVYDAIRGKGICDDVVCLDASNGYKITRFLEYARACDPFVEEEVILCMRKLRDFHGLKLEVAHAFDLFGQIEFYESLWGKIPSVYRDYLCTKKEVFSLKPYIDAHAEQSVLTHIDAVPDNFLFADGICDADSLQLIDWEYAGMQDPHVDIAMFCIYALYDREHVEQAIRYYFPEGCLEETRIKIHCYISVCGLLWSNWCEYKRNLGVEFGEYSIRQYRYAKDYYRMAAEEIEQMEKKNGL